MDREAPRKRPAGTPWGYQTWERLLFVHWELDPAAVQKLLPSGLTVDLYDGKAYVGLVPFYMCDVRLASFPRFLSQAFLETNLRTYVHVDGQDPGVYFFSLEAQSQLAVTAARWMWALPYYRATMSERWQGQQCTYRSDRVAKPAALQCTYQVGAELPSPQEGSLEFFLVERYYLHLEYQRSLWSGRVHHKPYPLVQTTLMHLSESLLTAAGLPAHSSIPDCVHFSPGVSVEIFPLRRRNP